MGNIRTLLINGLSFECNGDGDYDISPSDKIPRRVRVKQKNKDSEKFSTETKPVTPESTKMKVRDPTKIKRIRLPGKSRSSVKSSMKVSFSSKISSSDDPDVDEEADTSTVKDNKLTIPKVGGERGIFAKWPKKVIFT